MYPFRDSLLFSLLLLAAIIYFMTVWKFSERESRNVHNLISSNLNYSFTSETPFLYVFPPEANYSMPFSLRRETHFYPKSCNFFLFPIP